MYPYQKVSRELTLCLTLLTSPHIICGWSIRKRFDISCQCARELLLTGAKLDGPSQLMKLLLRKLCFRQSCGDAQMLQLFRALPCRVEDVFSLIQGNSQHCWVRWPELDPALLHLSVLLAPTLQGVKVVRVQCIVISFKLQVFLCSNLHTGSVALFGSGEISPRSIWRY